MEVVFAPRGILEINDAKIIYRNFSGRGDKFNREGDRNFSLLIPDTELADRLVEEGWNVKIKDPRDEGDVPFMHLPVKVKFNDRGPIVYLKTGNKQVRLYEDSVSCLDNIDILSVDSLEDFVWDYEKIHIITNDFIEKSKNYLEMALN